MSDAREGSADLGFRAAPSMAAAVTADPPHSATWSVGSLNPTVVKALTFVGFAVPVAVYLAVVAHYQVNAISGDQWSDVQVVAQNYGHFPNWSSLWALHTDNRVFFPNLIVIGLAHTVSLNIEVEEYLSALMLFGSVALLIAAHKRRSPTTPLLFYCPLAFVMLTLAQWQNALWGFQLAWFLVLFSLALSISLLDRDKLSWLVFGGAVLVAIVGSYSSVQGLLIWPTGLVLLYHRRRSLRAFVGWVVIAALTTALYFHNYHAPSASPHLALEHPGWVVRFFVFALGDIVGMSQTLGGRGNAAVLVFGIVILVLAVLVVVKWGIRRDEQSGAPVGVALIVFGLLFVALITEGRYYFGYWGASQSRYVTYDVLIVAGAYMTALCGSPSRAKVTTSARGRRATRWARSAVRAVRGAVDRVDRRVFLRVALLAIVIQVTFSVHYGIQGARLEHGDYVRAAALTRNIDHESDVQIFPLYYVESPQWIREQAAFLRKNHLSLFG
jgi:hypothetical protein